MAAVNCDRTRGRAAGPRKWAVLTCLALASVLLALVHVVHAQTPAAARTTLPSRQAGITIHEADEEHVLLEISLEGYSSEQEVHGGLVYSSVSLAGWGQSELSGAPQVPMRRVLLGVPRGATLHLSVTQLAPAEAAGPLRLRPAPEVIAAPDLRSMDADEWYPPNPQMRTVESSRFYGRDADYPGQVARIVEVGYIRDLRVAAIEIAPIQYNPIAERITFYPHFLVRLSYSGHDERELQNDPSSRSEPDSTNDLFAEVENLPTAEGWRQYPNARPDSQGWVPGPGALKLAISRDGFYQVTYDALGQAGADVVHLDPHTIQMFSGGSELAVRVVGEEDGTFDPGDYVLFYGEGITNKYTDHNVYWIVYGEALGRRMQPRAVQPPGGLQPATRFTSERRTEVDMVYSSLWPGEDGIDRWFQPAIASLANPAELEFDVNLGNVSTETVTATLWVTMKGHNEWPESNPDHSAAFFVNDQAIGVHSWDGQSAIQQVRVDFDQGLLKAGSNRFRTTFYGVAGAQPPRDVNFVLVDRYRVEYGHAFVADGNQLAYTQATTGTWEWHVTGFSDPSAQAFDVTDPANVVQLVGVSVEPAADEYQIAFADSITRPTTYEVLTPDRWLLPESIMLDSASNLHDTGNAADYIVVSHGDFLSAARDLADYRSGQGLRTQVVDIADVYDEFGYGLEVPEAIREFLRYTVHFWQPPAPLYVVLLGDGTFDPKSNLALGVRNFVPPYLSYVDPWMGEAATDNWYVTVVGEDIWPDLYLGRLPANSLAEAQAMVDKTKAYERSMEGADWNRNLTFVAGRQPDPKGAGNFHDLNDALVNDFVPEMYFSSKIYLGDIAGSTCSSPSQCKQQLVEQINAGTLLVTYTGHGSVIQWHRELWGGQWQSILDLPTLAQLTNSDRFPVMLPLTCLEGNFANPYPQSPAISESLVRASGKGAVASWGPTGLGVANGHDELSRGFLTALLFEGSRELGAATYAGKLRLYAAGHSLEQIQEYTVFGDPALRVNILGADLRMSLKVEAPQQVLPGDVLTFTLAFTNAGTGIAHNVVLSDRLPAQLVDPTVVHTGAHVISRQAGITFAWTLTNLLPHSGGAIRFRATVAPTATLPIAFFNRASIGSTTYDPAPWNNLASVGVGTSRVYLPLIVRGSLSP